MAEKNALAAAPGSIRIGCAGWSIPRLYAADFPGEDAHLLRYARVFSCVEINSSFYRSHRETTWKRWADSVPEDFRFSVKAPKLITHEAALACSPQQLTAFLAEAGCLGEKLGPLLFQLPPKLAFVPELTTAFFTLLRSLSAHPAVLEPRHPTWFTPEANELLTHFRIARAAADPSIAGEPLRPAGWPELAYYRLHGSPDRYYSAYTPDFLNELAGTLVHQSAHAAVWCIFDNTASGAATGNARTLAALVRRASESAFTTD